MICKFLAVLFLSLLSISNSFSVEEYIQGEGRFYSKDDDSLSFVKKQLHYNAVMDVMTKKMNELGLDPQLFWAKYNEQFEKYFAPIEESLRKKYGLDNEEKKPSARKVQDFNKALRHKRLSLKSSYGSLKNIIPSYIEKKLKRSVHIPNSRYLLIQAKVDSKRLYETYQRFSSNQDEGKYETLYISSSFELYGGSWEDLGVSLKTDFTSVIDEHWRKWFSEKYQVYFNEVVVVTEDKKAELSEFLRLPKTIMQSEEGAKVDEKYVRLSSSIWLDVHFTFKKKQENTLSERRKFSIQGEFIAKELRNGTSIHYGDVDPIMFSVSTKNTQDMSSQIASKVYNLPLDSWRKMDRSLRVRENKFEKLKIKITRLGSVQDLITLQKFLTEKGVIYSLRPKISNYSLGTGELELFYKGHVDQFKSFIEGINGTQISKRHSIKKDENDPLTFEMVGQSRNAVKESGEG